MNKEYKSWSLTLKFPHRLFLSFILWKKCEFYILVHFLRKSNAALVFSIESLIHFLEAFFSNFIKKILLKATKFKKLSHTVSLQR